MNDEELLSIKELAIKLKRTERTLRTMKSKGAPIFGGRAKLSEIREWQKQNSRRRKKV